MCKDNIIFHQMQAKDYFLINKRISSKEKSKKLASSARTLYLCNANEKGGSFWNRERMSQHALSQSCEAITCPYACITIGRVGTDWETHQIIQNTEVASPSNGGPRLRKSQDTALGNLESVDYKGRWALKSCTSEFHHH